jgi:excisionase family DNA binding protein
VDTREWMTVKQFLSRHKGQVGRNTLYDRVRDRTLPSVRLGKRILIPSDALDSLLEGGRNGQADANTD